MPGKRPHPPAPSPWQERGSGRRRDLTPQPPSPSRAEGEEQSRIQAQLAELCAADVSPALISDVTDVVHDEVIAWQSCPLDEIYAVVWLDGLVIKVRDEGGVKNKVTYLAIGLGLDGRKKILGLWLEPTEGAKVWLRVLSALKIRGVRDIFITRCDGLEGFPEAIEASFPQSVVRMCAPSAPFAEYDKRRKVAADLRAIYTADSEATALAALKAFETKWSKEFSLSLSLSPPFSLSAPPPLPARERGPGG